MDREQESDEIIRRLKAPPVQPIPHVIIPIITRIFPNIIANEIFSVQPMTRSKSKMHTMKIRYNDKPDES